MLLETDSHIESRIGDAGELIRDVDAKSVDVIITSPPYWQKRDYEDERQLGQERTPKEFVSNLLGMMEDWKRVLKSSGSVFLNLGDSIRDGCVVGVTSLFEREAMAHGWCLAARIVWTRTNGMPDPQPRLPQRYEYIFHIFPAGNTPFVDTYTYGQNFVLSQGNVWQIDLTPTNHPHLAPFPEELPKRALYLACPERVCSHCGQPIVREVKRGLKLNPDRPQAKRALERWHASGLTEAHLAAIRAVGISDAGKSQKFQSGAGRNGQETQRLAKEAKDVMKGYFRELTFAIPEHIDWSPCACGHTGFVPGLVLDPFVGTGTTLRAASALGRRGLGFDLKNWSVPIDCQENRTSKK